ncbi:MAG: hypothetical protein ACKVVP_02790 [Chloroflexota bacterium]
MRQDDPQDAFKAADIVAGCTDSSEPLSIGEWLEPGTHVVSVGGRPDDAAHQRFNVYLRLGRPRRRTTCRNGRWLMRP